MKPLANKIAFVTGGARGIGAAIVRRLAADGAQIALTYSKSSAEAEKLAAEVSKAHGIKAKAYMGDASKPATLPAVVQQVVKDFGGLDILVNNAGIFTLGVIGEVPVEEFQKLMAINVDAVFMTTNAAVPHMKAGGRIINISSGVGERAAAQMMSIYSPSKFAVTGFSRAWAKDLGAKGILVNAVQPGPIATDMNPENGDFAEYMRGLTSLGRFGKPEEVAGAVAFLAGPDSTYVTGAAITVDGGWNA